MYKKIEIKTEFTGYLEAGEKHWKHEEFSFAS